LIKKKHNGQNQAQFDDCSTQGKGKENHATCKSQDSDSACSVFLPGKTTCYKIGRHKVCGQAKPAKEEKQVCQGTEIYFQVEEGSEEYQANRKQGRFCSQSACLLQGLH
jgi:hypothetical protein